MQRLRKPIGGEAGDNEKKSGDPRRLKEIKRRIPCRVRENVVVLEINGQQHYESCYRDK
jgi:hypothetical protein